MTHTFDSEVSLHSWLLWPRVCQLVLRTSKSAGARGDVKNFGGCQAPAAPVLTKALVSVDSMQTLPFLELHTQAWFLSLVPTLTHWLRLK